MLRCSKFYQYNTGKTVDIICRRAYAPVLGGALACKDVASISTEFALAVRHEAPAGRRCHHVLLVEADRAVRDATRMLLRTDCYHVTAVESVAEGLMHAQAGERVDLLVTDYYPGGESAAQTIASLREVLGRSLKAVVMSDDTGSSVEQFRRDPLTRLVNKPNTAEELLNQLKALLALDN